MMMMILNLHKVCDDDDDDSKFACNVYDAAADYDDFEFAYIVYIHAAYADDDFEFAYIVYDDDDDDDDARNEPYGIFTYRFSFRRYFGCMPL